MILKSFEDFRIGDYLLLLSTILTIYVAQYYYKYFTRVNPLPGPFPFPFIGNLIQFYWWFKGNFKGLEELGVSGKGILINNNFKSWKYNRQFFAQAILSPKFNNEAVYWTNKLFNELEGYWNKLFLKEEIIKENQYTNDMIIKLLTGERSYSMAAYFDTLSDEKSDHPPAIVNDSVKLVQSIRKHHLGFILFYYQEIENTSLNKPLPNDMLTSVITANTPRDVNYTKTVGGEALDRPMTYSEIGGIIFDGFLGGSDTTANAISFIIYYIARNPDVKKKMIEEINRIFQGDKIRPITENDFQKLKYCEVIVKEVSRIFPRCIEKSDEITGYQWPAGTMFRINADVIHKNEDCCEDPDKFNPDRWMVEGLEPNKHSLLMFVGGLRICSGRKYEFSLKTISGSVIVCTELLVEIKPRD
uniref:Cytochrome P450 n=1 Tax=Rhizophagus irregularis (strain DAOM 181602 / DAOM 197198 / MUCL 43194) TaxID=747089 RepID=U9U7V9_RHIID